MKIAGLVVSLAAALLPVSALADDAEPSGQPVRAGVVVEEGFLSVFHNRFQFGEAGTERNFVTDGGQDNLFPTRRQSAWVESGRHRVVLLYQPVDLRSTTTLSRDLVVENTLFPAGSVVHWRYGFSFWRAGWSYDLASGPDVLALGAGLQIRNAAIEFAAADGSRFESKRDVGPVPLLSVRARRTLPSTAFLEFEADGFYAPVKYLNGGQTDVEGSILDANLRLGFAPRPWLELRANARYLGGGATGRSGNEYSENYLHTGALTLGAVLLF